MAKFGFLSGNLEQYFRCLSVQIHFFVLDILDYFGELTGNHFHFFSGSTQSICMTLGFSSLGALHPPSLES